MCMLGIRWTAHLERHDRYSTAYNHPQVETNEESTKKKTSLHPDIKPPTSPSKGRSNAVHLRLLTTLTQPKEIYV